MLNVCVFVRVSLRTVHIPCGSIHLVFEEWYIIIEGLGTIVV